MSSTWWSRTYDEAAELAEKGKAEALRHLENVMDSVSGDVDAICGDAKKHTVAGWRNVQVAKATLAGAGAAIVPFWSLLTLPADMAYAMRLMHRTATGVCFIKLGHANDETFAGVLAVWSGDVTLDGSLSKQVAAKAAATSGTVVGGPLGLKLSIKAFNLCTSALLAKKLGPKLASKVAAKLATKVAAQATTRWIPFVSAVASGGTNLWIIDGVGDAAEQYADFIRNATP